MDEYDVLSAALDRIKPPTLPDLAFELTRWRLVDRTARFGDAAWFDATRRLRDVADRLNGVVMDDAGLGAAK